jgi:hypothetical protein
VASVSTRFGIFGAGIESADDPRFMIEPQRARLEKEARNAHTA